MSKKLILSKYKMHITLDDDVMQSLLEVYEAIMRCRDPEKINVDEKAVIVLEDTIADSFVECYQTIREVVYEADKNQIKEDSKEEILEDIDNIYRAIEDMSIEDLLLTQEHLTKAMVDSFNELMDKPVDHNIYD